MKPTTKMEHEVVELSAKLTPLTTAEINRIKRTSVEHTALYTGKRVKCTECGHVWQQTGLKKQVRCPHCKTLLTLRATKGRKANEVEYAIVLQSCKSWQVARYFRVKWSCPVDGGRQYEIYEVVQHWTRSDGKHVVMARPRFMSFYVDSFCLDKPMSLKRCSDYRFSYRLPYCGVIVRSINPILKRNGFKYGLYGMQPFDLFNLLLTEPFAETLFKAGYGYLLRQLDYESKLHDENYVAASKIVMRNHYPLSRGDVDLWFDMVRDLLELGKDVRNSHFVCPADLKKAHDRAALLVKRKREREAAERRLEQLRKDKKLARSYVRRMKKYFDMKITDGNIVICVLKNLAEFEEEGAAMHHCVFANKYYAKPNSLVMSARVRGKRQETVEVNLKRFELVQSRGVNNSNSKYHEEIVQLVNANMFLIQQLSKVRRNVK